MKNSSLSFSRPLVIPCAGKRRRADVVASVESRPGRLCRVRRSCAVARQSFAADGVVPAHWALSCPGLCPCSLSTAAGARSIWIVLAPLHPALQCRGHRGVLGGGERSWLASPWGDSLAKKRRHIGFASMFHSSAGLALVGLRFPVGFALPRRSTCTVLAGSVRHNVDCRHLCPPTAAAMRQLGCTFGRQS